MVIREAHNLEMPVQVRPRNKQTETRLRAGFPHLCTGGCYAVLMMRTYTQYGNYKKPRWAPPAWLFAPVWTLLYIFIVASFGYAGYLYFSGAISFLVILPFALNLVFNLAFTTIQFRFRNFALAAVDVILVLTTLLWALIAIYPTAPWIAYLNFPYLAWVCFASVFQVTVTLLNRRVY